MHLAYLLIGSNLGDKATYLKNASSYIQQQCGQIVKQSSYYETEPWGFTEQPSFLNQAICIQTELAPAQLMHTLLQIESEMGRTRTIKMGPRTIDLDILQIDQETIDTPLLQLPHPAMHLRRFALIPMVEIAPTLKHPHFNKTMTQLLTECEDQTDVQKKIV
ncbi:MAG TPA: 2-amino-4-hydroxy-6-hydroxymethyldihydropteridine diphosphokinase [Sediminibacterium sp.]|uniref:2-amino-4-hydroxy-6- hydroxymethyldihydropteridine diphosphokinase n=1 Tax=Sediminibacterium sp. TaxID=1917865 RepID=UPI0008CE15D7|nr:2-amino-4-hydroxy-6-hydroxymethyldihydropteridine diphosphokinase [Sediminibacterium sp.]OHC85427.1 MAG: 2-amino-4-hydroxy-6-hydroxymethyldihydropteridine diphosphokinase [Sphingobacteriia bacterium RIFOXYC2_FULL_35_18]OHC89334.1 MAG: 2-amino-4-hydroxy-6-hydroxymethyldihydropteridine diphosphokinase [Sphingobacteriia bacterium RIFOXYD2_FULL_35_12]HLD53733.1 2-amino-4-hydroxy-6-hydroxymethyldihydropteridine diphosphokinase [Sediminibacterium sp.]